MRAITTRSLVWTVVLISVVVTIVTELRIAGYGVGTSMSAIVAYAAFFVNIACSGLGFRTAEWRWWVANFALSILTMTMIGAPTIPSALWTAGRVFVARHLT